MRRILPCLFLMLLALITLDAFAMLKPGFIVTPFSRSVTLAANSTTNILVVSQNNTDVNQTVTDVVPNIPSNSGIIGTIIDNSCGFLRPGDSCAALVKLQSGNKPSAGNLNISICSFNGTFCSQIVKPIDFNNTHTVGIFITPNDSSIANGTTQQFYAVGVFANSTIQDVSDSVTWSSSNTSKATISNTNGSQGLATGVGAGSSTISATLNGTSDSTTLTVTNATLTSIEVTPTNPSIANGFTQQFTATGIFSDKTHQDVTSLVTWSSSNTGVATISNTRRQKGLASSKSVGSTTITATLGSVSGSTTLQVTSAVLVSIAVTPTNPSITILTTQLFTAIGLYSDNTTKDLTNNVTWQTGSTLVAIISNQAGSKGKALGVGTGSTNVIAKLGNITGSTTLQVAPAVLVGIDVAPINVSLSTGSDQQYSATGSYNNGSNKDITTSVTWKSSNSNIATISNASGFQGLARGIQAGTVTISATLEGIVGSTNLTINPPTLQTITVTPIAPTIANNTRQQFIATGNYSDLTTKDLTDQVTWLTSAPSVAVISNAAGSNGLATALSAGSTIITATFTGVSGNTTLTVTAATLTAIMVTPANATIPRRTNQQFTATGTYSDLTTKIITNDVTWLSSSTSIATISNAALTKGIATGVAAGSTTISATQNSITGSTTLNVINVNIGDSLQGGKVACLNGGFNNLIAANSDNSNSIIWGGLGTTTNAQSAVDGTTNTTKIVSVLGAGINYAAGLCDAYEIDSAGNTPCVGGNTCYNDWFLPAINQLSCMRNNRNQIGGFAKENYWTSTEDSVDSSTLAFSLTFKNSGHGPDATNKMTTDRVRCVRIINAAP